MMMSNSSVKNFADFLYNSSLRFVVFLLNRWMALSTREPFLFFRFDVDDLSLSLLDIKSSTCLHKRMRRPTSFSPTLPMPLVGEYHVKGVRTPGSIETTRISAWVSQIRLCFSWTQDNFHSSVFLTYVNLQSLLILCGTGQLLFFLLVSKWRGLKLRLFSTKSFDFRRSDVYIDLS